MKEILAFFERRTRERLIKYKEATTSIIFTAVAYIPAVLSTFAAFPVVLMYKQDFETIKIDTNSLINNIEIYELRFNWHTHTRAMQKRKPSARRLTEVRNHGIYVICFMMVFERRMHVLLLPSLPSSTGHISHISFLPLYYALHI